MNVLDIVILALVALAAYEGLRLGAVLLVLSFGGFYLGMYLGALLASHTARWVHSTGAQTAVALGTTLGMAILLGTAGRLAGSRLFRSLHRGLLGPVDSGLGVLVAVVATLLAAWLVASTLASTSFQPVNRAVAGSRIVRTLDDVLPPTPDVFAQVQGFLDHEGFPPVFAQLAPLAAGPVALPGDSQVAAAVAGAGPSTVKIVGVGCGDIQEGSGFVVAPGLVVTNAHVVAGISRPTVEDTDGTHDTTVVLFDPEYDLAVLRVPGLTERPLTLDPATVGRGTQAAVLGYPGGGPFAYGPAGVTAEYEAQGRDIYGQGLTDRAVYEIQAVVRPGNSGGPLVEPDGTVIGVVFARSTTDGDVGYALTSPGVLARVRQAESASAAVGTGACVSD